MRRAVRITRQAISPRLAIRILANISSSLSRTAGEGAEQSEAGEGARPGPGPHPPPPPPRGPPPPPRRGGGLVPGGVVFFSPGLDLRGSPHCASAAHAL